MHDHVDIVRDYTAWVREATLPLIESWAREHGANHAFYRLMLDYPLRPAKGLRPALCLAACRALGGSEDAALPTAGVVELLHNAFLIHDDVEDLSLERRGRPTLAAEYGSAIAVNVADGMLGLALVPLLENTETIGLGAALRILERVVKTVLVTVEGQATELQWVQENRCRFEAGYREAYEALVRAKTAEYSFITPVTLGAMTAGADAAVTSTLDRYASHLGVAFQITDDLLNLDPKAEGYGKERAGDLWEGKRTLILLHALARAGDVELDRARAALGRERPRRLALGNQLEAMRAAGDLSEAAHAKLRHACGLDRERTAADVTFLEALIERYGGMEYARSVALEHASSAASALDRCDGLSPGHDRDFLHALVRYVVERLK